MNDLDDVTQTDITEVLGKDFYTSKNSNEFDVYDETQFSFEDDD